MKTTKKRNTTLVRVNTRIHASQHAYIKNEVKKSHGAVTEGDVHRTLLAEAIEARKTK